MKTKPIAIALALSLCLFPAAGASAETTSSSGEQSDNSAAFGNTLSEEELQSLDLQAETKEIDEQVDYDGGISASKATSLSKHQLKKYGYANGIPSVAMIQRMSGGKVIYAYDSTKISKDRVVKKRETTSVTLKSLGSVANKRFRFKKVSSGWYQLVCAESGYSLTVIKKNGKVKSGAKVYASKARGTKAQQWRLVKAGNDSYRLQSKANKKYYLTVSGSSLKVKSKGSNSSQAFNLLVPTTPLPNGTYSLRTSLNTSKMLTVANNSKKSKANVIVYTGSRASARMWKLSYEKSSGYYLLTNARSGKRLELYVSPKTRKANVRQNSASSSMCQRWLITPAAGDEGYVLRNASNGQSLTTYKSRSSNGTNVLTGAYNSSKKAQSWQLREATTSTSWRNCTDKLNLIDQEGTNEAYHPKVVAFDEPWNGYRFWMAFTPYPKGNATYEDPYLMASNDMVNWEAPEGLKNPIHDTRADGSYDTHNSDTHLVYNPETDQLEIFWRWIDSKTTVIYRSKTSDGVNLSNKEKAYYDSNRNNGECISPAIVLDNGVYKMWYLLNSRGDVMYRTSTDGKNWSKANRVYFPFTTTQMKVWHLDVEKTDRGYEALLSAYDQWCNRNSMCLWYSTSRSETSGWNTPTVILKPSLGSNNWDNRGIYRSCMVKINDCYVIYYSGTSSDYHHGIGIAYGTNIKSLTKPNVNFNDKRSADALIAKLSAATRLNFS